MGGHRLLCGDATKESDYALLMQSTVARMIVTDPPYNVAYEGAAGSIQNDDLGSGFYDFLLAAFRPILTHCDGDVYISMSSSELDTLQKAFRDAGGHWSTFVIWAKDRFTLGRSDYQRQYEPILYGWREGASRHWCGDRDQGDVWSKRSTPCRSSEPFGGSGTTLIAAEKSGRHARIIELESKFVDVIVRRWQEFSGGKAIRESDGLEFDAVQRLS